MNKFERRTAVAGLGVMVASLAAIAIESGRMPGMHPHHASKPAAVAAANHGGHGQSLPELTTLAADLQPASPAPSHENSTLTTTEAYLALGGVVVFCAAMVPDINPSRRQPESQPDATPPVLPTQPSGESVPLA